MSMTPSSPITWPRHFSGEDLLQIAMPMGGIGSGCICLSGQGGIQDFSVRNNPGTTALADGHGFDDAAFALLRVAGADGASITRLVEGPLPWGRIYDQGLQAQGYRKGGQEGLPRFTECAFESAYPFGTVRLSDPALPLTVQIEGWNPFIPRDGDASSIPAAILEYTLENTGAEPVDYEFSYHLSHLASGAPQSDSAGSRNALLADGSGVFLSNNEPEGSVHRGSAALLSLGDPPAAIKAMWFRGGWFDALSALWREVSTGSFRANAGLLAQAPDMRGRNGGSILFRGTLAPGQRVTHTVALCWHFPNSGVNVGQIGGLKPPVWNPYYTTLWSDAAAVAAFLRAHITELRERTRAFQRTLAASTLPPAVLDAVASNLAILKSPTVLRQANGNIWGWEGCFPGSGCCHGTCTHVWNYAQALPHLFPLLEQTLREQEYLRSMDGRGHVNFRAALPDAPTNHDYHAAADGQLGGLLKLYRDWQIGGDTEWLRRLYPLAKRSLDFCIRAWDPDEEGALREPHHNTYDIEFWGREPMCTTVYIGALSALAEIGRALGEDEKTIARYQEIAARGAALMETELFNGDYYAQRVQWEGLRDTSFADQVGAIDPATDDEMSLLLLQEGPKYQYGPGCLSDGVIGDWMARLYGVDTPLRRVGIRAHLAAIFRHNFRSDLWDHACTQRPGYANGHEAGLLLCTWPNGGKPVLPFVYSDEVWTGIEYQVATHLILEGMVAEGLALVEAVRSRFDGRVRNPFNEYECGNYYARAMASFALLPALSGFRYSAVTRTLEFGSAARVAGEAFVIFFSTASGYGLIRQVDQALTVEMTEGELVIERLLLRGETEEMVEKEWQATARVGAPVRYDITF